MSVTIPLGNEDRVSKLYSFPNSPTCSWTLAETVKHWLDMTLDRDGLAALGARASVRVDGKNFVVVLDGPDSVMKQLQGYQTRLPQFLNNGWDALTKVVPKIKAAGRWDPSPDKPKPGQPPYHPWRFFLPHGMAMLNQKAVLFFHYPPIRLLDTNQDYLDDPVPVRCEELLTANGVSAADLPLFNTVMDATPIGAEDDQGSKKAGDPTWGLIPIQDFHDYQRAQVQLLSRVGTAEPAKMSAIVYGAHPLATFNDIYKTKLKNNQVGVANIVSGAKTPVMASTHPYVFYGMAQGFDDIGSGKMVDPKAATAQMLKDLVVARWLKLMADDPSQDPQAVLESCQKYWNDPAQAATVNALVSHQGSLYYSNPTTLTFEFLVPLPTIGQPAAPTATTPPAAVAAAPPAAQPQANGNGLTVMGDSGKPVDWWFIYKVSEESQTTTGDVPTGAEYAYFDSEMAAQPNAKVVLSPNRINQSGALIDTLRPLFTSDAKANKNLGWYCYNDEDHQVKTKTGGLSGTGPADRGHCKGVLAFDLATNTAFWLIHSVPLFPTKAAFDYPPTGLKMAQTMLCIQLDDADTAKNIAQLMYDAHGPNVNVFSAIPAALAADDPRVALMKDLNGSMQNPKPYSGRVAFNSRGGQKFLAIAKNKAWGNRQDDPDGAKDFYNDLVGPTLNEDIEVETWQNAGPKIPDAVEHGEAHEVENMKSVNLAPLGIPYSWSEKVDHAKLALSDRKNPAGTDRWVCVGDINFTLAQERRGGGTVAFKCESLWSQLVQALSDQPEPSSKRPSKRRATSRRTSPQT